MLGSTYSTVKRAVFSRLDSDPDLAGVAVGYQAPTKTGDIDGDAGSRETIWLADAADGDYSNVVFGALPLVLDETYRLMVVVQVLRRPSQDESNIGTQEVADVRVDQLIGVLIGALAADPHFGIQPGDAGPGARFEYVNVTRGGFVRTVGFLAGSGGHGAGCELELVVNARVSFT